MGVAVCEIGKEANSSYKTLIGVYSTMYFMQPN